MRRSGWVLGLALAAFGCKELPEIESGVCGNRVLEPPEDCDGFAREGAPCRPPGSIGECRLDCSDETACPAGWGCTAEAFCRPPTGEFVPVGDDIPGNAASLLAGDFDDDGRDDIVGVERPGSFGLTKVRVHYFDDDALPVETWTSDKLLASPVIADVSADGLSDIVYSNGSVAVLVGQPDRSLLPQAYPSYFIGSSAARAIVVHHELIEDSAAFVILAERDRVNGIFVADFESARSPEARRDRRRRGRARRRAGSRQAVRGRSKLSLSGFGARLPGQDRALGLLRVRARGRRRRALERASARDDRRSRATRTHRPRSRARRHRR